MSFYRALRVYPSPVELIMIYQKTVPDPIFKVYLHALFATLEANHRILDGDGYDKPGRKFTTRFPPEPQWSQPSRR